MDTDEVRRAKSIRACAIVVASALAVEAPAGCAVLFGLDAHEGGDAATAADGGGDGAELDGVNGGGGDASDGGAGDASTSGQCHDGVPHDFCDDFEGTAAETNATGLLVLVADAGDAPSPPHVMRATIERGGDPPASQLARVSLQGPWPWPDGGAQPKVKISLKLRVRRADVSGYGVGIMGAVLGNGEGGQDSVGVFLDGLDDAGVAVRMIETYWVGGAAAYGGGPTTLHVPLDTWTTITLAINARPPGENGGYSVSIVDGGSASFSVASSSRTNAFRIDIGIGGGSGGGTWTLDFDDVALDYAPPPP